mmetsp:Transcript_31365/g.27582  ORF Transcript_31365/g.27582 Transcript_31365/m.27582 type:complete len:257 (-) Transcript_31365:20-790(-)|eukprot:CAMPEP_0201582410 /NCGR_PEP_ID=MMETSP0190_2-20130828/84853_1 /ASSEMBLY_ACC=CAM_ASM_000263 /TAXON_ID=37353 /ORGANISM="Rosalina sp." /LENGTH=256 /DNA_ID=CAMNT_0048022253 /DNA_START=13 /DNA_END=783 /DNA_ORIENTATION=-
MGGACCGCDVWADEKKQYSYSPISADKKKKNQDQNPFHTSVEEEKDADVNIEDTEDWKEYKQLMQLVFYTFAGYQPWAKVTSLYMHQKELQRFLEIVNINDPVEDVFKIIDATDVEDGRLTMNEWMDYFTNKDVNEGVFVIKEHIEEQLTWELLTKALKIFQKMDADHSGKLEYGEFRGFGTCIGLNEEETELLWNQMDTNNSGAIDITELFEWFRLRLYAQRGRIATQRNPSIMFNKEEQEELEEFRNAQSKDSP